MNLKKSKKRNSDLIKKIYKTYFRNYFKFHSKKNPNEHFINNSSINPQDHNLLAFTCMFQNISDNFPFDFYMDIISGKMNDTNIKSLSQKNNWNKKKKSNKLYKLNQISKSLRYFITIDPDTKNDFIQFLENDKNPFSLKNILKKKINDFISFISIIYKDYLQYVDIKEFDSILKQLEIVSMNIPYTQIDIDKGINVVKNNMNSPYNKKVFMDCLKNHYSFNKVYN